MCGNMFNPLGNVVFLSICCLGVDASAVTALKCKWLTQAGIEHMAPVVVVCPGTVQQFHTHIPNYCVLANACWSGLVLRWYLHVVLLGFRPAADLATPPTPISRSWWSLSPSRAKAVTLSSWGTGRATPRDRLCPVLPGLMPRSEAWASGDRWPRNIRKCLWPIAFMPLKMTRLLSVLQCEALLFCAALRQNLGAELRIKSALPFRSKKVRLLAWRFGHRVVWLRASRS